MDGQTTMRSSHAACRRTLLLALFTLLPLGATPARADGGFALNHYEPTSAGSWFLAVEHPWYSSTRWFAAALTLDYAHNPLVYGTVDGGGNFTQSIAVVGHQLVGHVDLAASFLDRVHVALSLPITFGEWGSALDANTRPIGSAAVGDPRIGVMVRLWQQPDVDAVSLHLGATLWIPIGAQGDHAGDEGARFEPRLIASGVTYDHLRWSASLAYHLRSRATFAPGVGPDGNSAGQELRLAGAVQYTDSARIWALGPELLLASVPTDGHFFDRGYTAFEGLLSGHYLIASQLLVSAAAGFGAGHSPGTPDFRALLRLAWAPSAEPDRDGDGIADRIDACPDVKGLHTEDPRSNGCPLVDRDGDGVADAEDLCPDVPRGDRPDPRRRGCPVEDRDRDGVLDFEDLCPDEPQGASPDAQRKGCPAADRDHDLVPDAVDGCPDVHHGPTPDPRSPGCPAPGAPVVDRDGDGVLDGDDKCPDVKAGLHPDPARPGCPAPDRDGDAIPDATDACPDAAGAPDVDPKKNGCPGLVTIKDGRIAILVPVFFATDKDIILPKSFDVLAAVANTLRLEAGIRRVAIEGHTDSKGSYAHNVDLSARRARSVMRWLVLNGIAADRLEAHGYGPDRPIAPNATEMGRAKNRRVDFVIVDPAPAARTATKPEVPARAAAPTPAAKHPAKVKHRPRRRR